MTLPANMTITPPPTFQSLPVNHTAQQVTLPEWAIKLAWEAVDLHEKSKHSMLTVSFHNGRWRVFVSRESANGLIE